MVAVGLLGFWFGVVDREWLDDRPVQRVLWLGDSYTYANNLPAMVSEMADSAPSAVRFDITTRAFGSASLEDHWNDSKTRALLSEGGWDRVIIQPETFHQVLDGDHAHFSYGAKLLRDAGEAKPAIVVSWTASEAQFPDGSVSRREAFEAIESNHAGLAVRTGAELIDAARVWEDLLANPPPFPLYSDGNHPSVQGTYAAALVVYARLAAADPGEVTYVPRGMSADEADILRRRVRQSVESQNAATFVSQRQGGG
jgi:hypothetical protein